MNTDVHFLGMQIGLMKLAVPIDDVQHIASSQDVRLYQGLPVLRVGKKKVPVYQLKNDLQPGLPRMKPGEMVVVLSSARTGPPFGLVCKMTFRFTSQSRLHALPAFMQLQESPFSGILNAESGPILITHGEILNNHLERSLAHANDRSATLHSLAS